MPKWTVKACLAQLSKQKSFTTLVDEPSDPFLRSMWVLQTFTTSVIQALNDKHPEVIALATDGSLYTIYQDLPSFQEPAEFSAWVKDATLKHPLRRTAKQSQFLDLVLQQEKVLAAKKQPLTNSREFPFLPRIITHVVAALESWKTRALSPERLDRDYHELAFFYHMHKIQPAETAETECAVCTYTFDSTTHAPEAGPCGHILCKSCFRGWMDEINETFSCPLCRACLVCGLNPCTYHAIKRDIASPCDLSASLNTMLVGGEEGRIALLHSHPQLYWDLRESTRALRVKVAWVAMCLEGTSHGNLVIGALDYELGELVVSLEMEIKGRLDAGLGPRSYVVK